MNDDGSDALSLGSARQDVQALRRSLEAGVSVEARATSIDGRTFEFQAPLEDPVPLGGFAVIETEGGRTYLGQVTEKRLERRDRAKVTVDVPEIALGAAVVSSAELNLEARMAIGGGTLLGRVEGGNLEPLTTNDVFDQGSLDLASAEVLARYLEASRSGAAALDIGWSPFGGPDTRITLRSAGFSRHTFLCGQSGSGKTFSLGVVLERLLVDTTLPMIIIDPNSDFVTLNELRGEDAFARTVAQPPADYDQRAAEYEQAADGVHVLRAGGDAEKLSIRFSDLTPYEQATVLKLDPLAHRAEFRAYRSIADEMGDHSYSVDDVQDVAKNTLQEDARQIGLRIENLGLADWEVWAGDEESAVGDHLGREPRALVLDIGGLSSADEKSVVAMSLLGRLWRKRADRKPVLVVIDEAHNVCPAEPTNDLQALATEHVIRIAGEGRKFGIYLLLSTQRPQKLHPNVLSQCDNLILMRMNSDEDVAHLAGTFSFVPPRLLEESTGFSLGHALVAGKISPTPMLARFEGRLSREGGGDVPAAWAAGTET